jgi:type I restriction enzyme, S subunit
MRKYDSYKDSGVDWIGEIPNDWSVKRMCYLFLPTSIKSTEGEINLSVYRDYGVIPRDSRDDNHNVVSEDTSNYKLVEVGDFVMNKMKCWMGSLGLSEFRGIVSPSYTVMKPLTNDNSRFLHYLLRSPFYIPQYRRLSYGVRIGQWDLRFEDFRDLSCILPPISEQQQIVSFLDTKTSLIDSLIEKTQLKIELLKENRTSLINEVVTKGLNPNVEMKDSGVEWIGEIPSHWEVKRLKHITKSINGFSFKSDDFDREFDIPVIRIGDVGDVIDFGDCVKVKSHFLEDKKEFIVKKDDILIGLTGGTIGKSGKYNYDSPSLLNQRVGLLRNKPSVLNGLLYHYVKSEVFIRYIFFDCYGGGQDNISMGDILNMVFPYPPLSEQQQIVSYLDEHTQLIDKTISVEERRIELLKEYRQSLISEVVTGKRKVVTYE